MQRNRRDIHGLKKALADRDRKLDSPEMHRNLTVDNKLSCAHDAASCLDMLFVPDYIQSGLKV